MGTKIQKRWFKIWKKYIYHFQQYETIRFLAESIYAGKINRDEAEMDESNLWKNIVEFNNNNNNRPRIEEDKYLKKRCLWKCICSLLRSRITY